MRNICISLFIICLWLDHYPVDAQRAERFFEQGMQQFDQSAYKEAIETLTKAIQADQGMAKAWFRRGIAHNRLGEPDKGFSDISRAVALDSVNIDYLATHAYLCLAWAGKYDLAIRDYNRIAQLDPEQKELYFSRGYAFLKAGRYQEAMDDFTMELGRQPQSDKCYLYRGMAYEELDRQDEALTDYSVAIDLNAESKTAFQKRGLIRYSRKQYAEAIGDLTRSLTGKEDPLRILLRISIAAWQIADSNQCRKHLELAVSRDDRLRYGRKGLLDMQEGTYHYTPDENRILETILNEFLPAGEEPAYHIAEESCSKSNHYKTASMKSGKYTERETQASPGYQFLIVRARISGSTGKINFPSNGVFLILNPGDKESYVELESVSCVEGDDAGCVIGFLKGPDDKGANYWVGSETAILNLLFEVPVSIRGPLNLRFVDVITKLEGCVE